MKLFFDLFPIILFFGAFKFGESDPQTAADILTLITGGTGPEHAPVMLATLVAIVSTFVQIAIVFARGKKPEAPAGQLLEVWRAFARENFPQLEAKPAVLLGESVLLPPACPPLGLHILRAGVLAGTVQKGRFVPAHHLFTAYGALCANSEPLTKDDPRCRAWLLGQEIDAVSAAPGWCCVTVDGCPLGGGKASAGRIKNHYPKALRLLG